MNSYYVGKRQARNETPEIVSISQSKKDDPSGYHADPKLAAAVNVALFLGQPLLLTGKPGVGKTQLAHSVSWELAMGKTIVFHTKSTSVARDLFYTYDVMRRFYDIQLEKEVPKENEPDYVQYKALGRAILLANPLENVRQFLPNEGFQHDGPKRSVVLIDEIDKAPRDFPNDLLHEIEQMSFAVPELNLRGEIKTPENLRPIIIITSNAEKNLPDAFLRRCVYHHIDFPDDEVLEEIVARRLEILEGDPRISGIRDVVAIHKELRSDAPARRMSKVPATAELISWVQLLMANGLDLAKGLASQKKLFEGTIGALAKTEKDLPIARQILNDWK